MEPAWGQHDETWEELLRRQSGAASRQQALEHEWTPGRIDAKTRSGRWQRPHPGVFVTFTGPLPWSTKVWAGLLHAGPDAVASHRTAARLASLLDVDPTPIELLVPWGHRVTPRAHLVDLAASAQDAVGWLTRACQRRATTPQRLLDVAAGRRRLRYRRLVVDVLSVVSTGVASPLELRYVRDVERRHGLPSSVRGQRVVAAGRHWYADVRYAPLPRSSRAGGSAVASDGPTVARRRPGQRRRAVRGRRPALQLEVGGRRRLWHGGTGGSGAR
jgi:hypothetical protein